LLLNTVLKIVLSMLFTNPLQDAGWIGVIVAVIIGIATIVATVAVTVWAVRKQGNRKEIAYEVRTDTPIVSINEEVKDRIKIEFDGQPVEAMSLLNLKVWNAGDVSVKTDDYVDPLTFTFAGRKVLDVSILSMEPENLIKAEDLKKFLEANKPLQSHEKETIELPKFHLNSKKRTGLEDTLTLKVLLSGSKGSIKVEGRIDDGKIIYFDPNNQPVSIWLVVSIFGTIILSLPVLFLIGILVHSSGLTSITSDLSFIVILTIIALIYWRKTLSQIRKTGIRW
jgi:hypothetical protein